jgi:hypothetical protein
MSAINKAPRKICCREPSTESIFDSSIQPPLPSVAAMTLRSASAQRETNMETIAVMIVFAIAVGYLYRRFKNVANPDQHSCGCSGCGGCAAPKNDPKQK